MSAAASEASLEILLRTLKLPSFVAAHEELGERAERDGWSVNARPAPSG